MKSTETLTADILCRAEQTHKKNALRRRQFGTVLGALVLVAVLGVGVWQITLHRQPAVPDDPTGWQTTPEPTFSLPPDDPTGRQTDLEPTIGMPPELWITIPKLETKLPTTNIDAACWAYAFVVHQGSKYCSSGTSIDYSQAEDNHLLGEKIGTTIGSDEVHYWMEHPEAYEQEGASNIAGGCEIYTVNGYDPSFRLAVVQSYTEYTGENAEEVSGKAVYILDKLNGITLRCGWDLFGKRLHLRERMVSAVWQSYKAWYHGSQTFYPLNSVTPEQWTAFFDALDTAPFEDTSDIKPPLYKSDNQKHLVFTLSDSLTVTLYLYADGYVSLESSSYKVKMPGDAFDAIYQACR